MNTAQLINSIPTNHAPLFLEFLSVDEAERTRVAAGLRALLERQRVSGAPSHGAITSRRPLGLYVLLSRSIAWGLVAALELPSRELNELREHLMRRTQKINSLSRNEAGWGEEAEQ